MTEFAGTELTRWLIWWLWCCLDQLLYHNHYLVSLHICFSLQFILHHPRTRFVRSDRIGTFNQTSTIYDASSTKDGHMQINYILIYRIEKQHWFQRNWHCLYETNILLLIKHQGFISNFLSCLYHLFITFAFDHIESWQSDIPIPSVYVWVSLHCFGSQYLICAPTTQVNQEMEIRFRENQTLMGHPRDPSINFHHTQILIVQLEGNLDHASDL